MYQYFIPFYSEYYSIVCIYHIYLSVYLLMDILGSFWFMQLWLLQINPLWTFDQTWACFDFLGKYLEVEGLHHRIDLCIA